ncbi:LANO_0E07294g1_1 [Lachancea nothofagi CBS 11611]|uniref:LANO_0E07294g1_1 n=1 Tax=Lachancea nothofagi CBS 11611 TaxID=1266666 RepID=A0A1G4JUG5_9SACH|nr:LANO_0E07294g1_1 [Lachancea nothofagi CBS 11611]
MKFSTVIAAASAFVAVNAANSSNSSSNAAPAAGSNAVGYTAFGAAVAGAVALLM